METIKGKNLTKIANHTHYKNCVFLGKFYKELKNVVFENCSFREATMIASLYHCNFINCNSPLTQIMFCTNLVCTPECNMNLNSVGYIKQRPDTNGKTYYLQQRSGKLFSLEGITYVSKERFTHADIDLLTSSGCVVSAMDIPRINEILNRQWGLSLPYAENLLGIKIFQEGDFAYVCEIDGNIISYVLNQGKKLMCVEYNFLTGAILKGPLYVRPVDEFDLRFIPVEEEIEGG